jgi:hypothetical protein
MIHASNILVDALMPDFGAIIPLFRGQYHRLAMQLITKPDGYYSGYFFVSPSLAVILPVAQKNSTLVLPRRPSVVAGS